MTETALVLTYHSISDMPGPTSIPLGVFAMQMETLSACGYKSATLDQFLAWHEGKAALDRRVLITFDDAFADFVENAVPVLQRHGLSALMFVPTRKLGGVEDWYTAPATNRPLMRRDQIVTLAGAGLEFGAHSRTHPHLTQLSPAAREEEIGGSGDDLAEWLGRPTLAFAAPYGDVDAQVVGAIAGRYPAAFGTRFAKVRRGQDRHDIPRIDMHYFRNARAWRNFLEGGTLYFRARQAVRHLGQRIRG